MKWVHMNGSLNELSFYIEQFTHSKGTITMYNVSINYDDTSICAFFGIGKESQKFEYIKLIEFKGENTSINFNDIDNLLNDLNDDNTLSK